MKKVFFSFAIATMMASLMACGGKTEQNAEGQDSTAVEAEAEEAAEPAANIVDNDAASVTLPEGWIIDTCTAKNFRVVLPKEGDTAET